MGRSPSTVFNRVHELFTSLGLLNREIILELSGASYKIKCDENSFMVYRVHKNCGPRSHVPGWPVCLVTHDTIFEECLCVDSIDDCFHCGLSLEKWLEIIETSYKRKSKTLIFSSSSDLTTG